MSPRQPRRRAPPWLRSGPVLNALRKLTLDPYRTPETLHATRAVAGHGLARALHAPSRRRERLMSPKEHAMSEHQRAATSRTPPNHRPTTHPGLPAPPTHTAACRRTRRPHRRRPADPADAIRYPQTVATNQIAPGKETWHLREAPPPPSPASPGLHRRALSGDETRISKEERRAVACGIVLFPPIINN